MAIEHYALYHKSKVVVGNGRQNIVLIDDPGGESYGFATCPHNDNYFCVE